uniref:zinc finger protein RFP-like n=1 Tax=Euleptes europaea TaxID=460621 RepID=UPI0025413982|nr:zinc finger protein RFP-like [Euleptes europaea]
MAEESPVQGLCEETTCSICLEYFKDPVIIDCGHIYCHACLTEYCGKFGTDASCPQCRETVQQKSFRPNRQLASIVELAKKFSLQLPSEIQSSSRIGGAEAPGQVCARHQEPLKLFCEDDQAPICVVCDKSKEHRGHKVIPKEEAFEEYKGKVQDYLDFLKEEREAIRSSQQNGEVEGQILLELTEGERQKITAEFKQLHQFLEDQEHHVLAKLKDLEDLIKDKRKAHIDKLCEEISAVDLLIKEMEEKQKQPASEFLQDLRNVLQRCNKGKFVNPVAFSPELKQEIENFFKMHPFLDTTMKEFKDTVNAGPEAKKANVTDCGTCTIPTLVLSANNLWSSSGYSQQHSSFSNFHQNPNLLSCWSYIMGVERINSGKCSWVINTKNEKFWAVGVALECFRGRNVTCLSSLTPEQGFWAVWKSTDNYWYVFSSSQSHRDRILCPWSSSWVPAQRIGPCNTTTIHLSLNYEQGSVTFVNAANNSVIYTFPKASFQGQQISSFFVVGK